MKAGLAIVGVTDKQRWVTVFFPFHSGDDIERGLTVAMAENLCAQMNSRPTPAGRFVVSTAVGAVLEGLRGLSPMKGGE